MYLNNHLTQTIMSFVVRVYSAPRVVEHGPDTRLMRIKLSKTQTARVKFPPVHCSGFYYIRKKNLHFLSL